MTTIPMYSLRTDPGGYRITKFVDGEVESSYAVTESECECPAGHRHTCRHRQMLPTMLAHGIANTHWFYLHDRGGQIVDFNGTQKHLLDRLAGEAQSKSPEAEAWSTILGENVTAVHGNVPIIERESLPDTGLPQEAFDELGRIPGVQVFTMDNLLGIHNAIADAVGEPEAKLPDTALPTGHSAPSRKPWRRI